MSFETPAFLPHGMGQFKVKLLHIQKKHPPIGGEKANTGPTLGQNTVN